MNPCPPPEQLHALLDGALDCARGQATEEHLLDCASCRDALRLLRRVDRFSRRGATAVAPPDAVQRVLAAIPGTAPETAARPGRRLVPVAALAATAMLAVLVVSLDLAGGGRSPQAAPVPGVTAAARLEALLSTAEPDLGEPRRPDLLLEELERLALEQGLVGRTPGSLRSRLERALRVAGEDLDRPARLRRARVLILAGGLQAARDLARLLDREELPPVELAYGLRALGDARQGSGVHHLSRLARRRSLPPGPLAEALAASGRPHLAGRVFALLRASGWDHGRRYAVLHRLPGAPASRILVDQFIAGVDTPDLQRILLERPSALRLLQERLGTVKNVQRVRFLHLLGLAGRRDAVPHLERYLEWTDLFPHALRALTRLARAGVEGAARAIVRALPVLENPDGWPDDDRSRLLVAALRDLNPTGRQAILAGLSAQGLRRSARRRLLLAVGIMGGPECVPPLLRAAARAPDRKAALCALALSKQAGAATELARLTTADDRALRHCALSGLLLQESRAAAGALVRAMARPDNRRFLRDRLPADAAAWGLPVLVEALRYWDTRDRALELLREHLGERAPRGADVESWKRALGLEWSATGPPAEG